MTKAKNRCTECERCGHVEGGVHPTETIVCDLCLEMESLHPRLIVWVERLITRAVEKAVERHVSYDHEDRS